MIDRRFHVVDLGTQIDEQRRFAVWDATVSRFWKINGHQTWVYVGDLDDDFRKIQPPDPKFRSVSDRQRDEIAMQAFILGFDQDEFVGIGDRCSALPP